VASNQWSLPDDSEDVAMIPAFIESWMLTQPPDRDLPAASEEWAWKVSYVRGVIYAAAFKMYVGVPGEMPPDEVAAAIDETRVIQGMRNDWDPKGFRAGLDDITAVGFSHADVAGFWASDACKVTLDEAVRALRELGGRIPGGSSLFLPPELAGAASEE
jgi:hypothetical protein